MPKRESEEWFWQVGGDLQKLGDELSPGRPRVAHRKSWEPRVDLYEEATCFVLRAELAGARAEAIELTYVAERNAVLLKGDRPEQQGEPRNRVGVYQLEILYGAFEREIPLPNVPIDPSAIRAQYKNGFLVLLIPKRERSSLSGPLKIESE